MKLAGRLLLLLLLAVSGRSRVRLATSLLGLTDGFGSLLPKLSRPANHSRIFYAVMFDAGSTGTRVHVYTFIQSGSEQLPILDNEMFHSIKPGLSAYADSPETAGHTVRTLLKVAKKTVPRLEWKRCPLVLRATAGLRLLAEDKAQVLLQQVQHVFDESPFLVPDDSVGVMNGTYEGLLAWISLNYLTGHLSAQTKNTVGILDLGGGSTQITFLPNQRKTIESVPAADYVARFGISNTSFELYTYSYLGNGLMAARLATLGALGAEGTGAVHEEGRRGWFLSPVNNSSEALSQRVTSLLLTGLEWRVFRSSCLPKKFKGEWSFGELTYRVSGDPEGFAGYKLCYQEVLKAVKGIIHQPYKLEDSNVFYAFSYYFDRAVDAGLIDGDHGGMLQVRDFKKRAKEVCNEMSKSTPTSAFLCMDMTYITCLLKDGFGFKESTVLKLTKKVNNVEASWALGAVLDHFHNLKIH
uniref:nucleoside diphosphate phosphatase n=1 Tax=Gasterosteus aculeatus aculeatus TaxID=481459 RepID=A0AAQ4RNX6_GASAC